MLKKSTSCASVTPIGMRPTYLKSVGRHGPTGRRLSADGASRERSDARMLGLAYNESLLHCRSCCCCMLFIIDNGPFLMPACRAEPHKCARERTRTDGPLCPPRPRQHCTQRLIDCSVAAVRPTRRRRVPQCRMRAARPTGLHERLRAVSLALGAVGCVPVQAGSPWPAPALAAPPEAANHGPRRSVPRA